MRYWKNNHTVLNQIIDEVAGEMDLGNLVVKKVHEWANINNIPTNEFADCCYELVQDVEEKIKERVSNEKVCAKNKTCPNCQYLSSEGFCSFLAKKFTWFRYTQMQVPVSFGCMYFKRR